MKIARALPALAFGLAACGGGMFTSYQVDEAFDRAIGATLPSAIAAWGTPSDERTVVGRRLVTWKRGTAGGPFTSGMVVGAGAGSGNAGMGISLPVGPGWCELTWEVGPDARLVSWKYSGGMCGSFATVVPR